MLNQKTAVLLFTRSSKEESKAKRLITKNRKANSSVIKSMTNNALNVANSSGYQVFHVSENLQKGDDFGSRLANAFKQIFDRGFEQVISIGNDCLELNSTKIREAKAHLENNNFVFGPDARGGLYLIGINKISFDYNNFIDQFWGQKNLWSAWSQELNKNSQSYEELNILSDVNFFEDLLSYCHCSKVKNQFKSILIFWIIPIKIHFSLVRFSVSKPYFYSNLFHRPPPYFIG